MDQLIAQLEGLIIGLEWKEEKSAAHLIRLAIRRMVPDPLPKLNKRRPLDDDSPQGYAESDIDFVNNNLEAAVMLLEKALEHQNKA